MKKLKLIRFSIFIILVIGCQSEISSISEDTEDQIDAIFSAFDDPAKPGAAVAVVKNGKIIFKKGYGSANLEYGIPVTPSTIFHIASISKQFTVFSILLLESQGKLSFDDDIRTYIPEVPDFGKEITLRHLASHTSGMRDQWNLLAMGGWRLDDVITKEQVLKLVANQKELNFEPGEEYLYCNTGFTLLAEVVARVSNSSFGEFTQNEIFEPLGMSNTLFYEDHEEIVENRAYSYYSDNSGYKKSVLSYANAGATSLFTTVEDLALWTRNFINPKVGSTEIIEQINELATLNNGETFGGAYGQFVDQYKGLNQIQHGGADAGYRNYLGRFPDQDFAVIVFSNYAFSNPGGLALETADIFLEEEFIEESTAQAEEELVYVDLANEELNAFTGMYWNEAGLYSREILLRNDTLRYVRGEGNETKLVPTGSNTFSMLDEGPGLRVKFEGENMGQKMIFTQGDNPPIVSESYIPFNYTAEDLKELTGTFYSDELKTSYTIALLNDLLIVKHSRLSDITITPLKKDLFKGDQWFFETIKFERSAPNTISGISVSAGRVRNLTFDKIENQ